MTLESWRNRRRVIDSRCFAAWITSSLHLLRSPNTSVNMSSKKMKANNLTIKNLTLSHKVLRINYLYCERSETCRREPNNFINHSRFSIEQFKRWRRIRIHCRIWVLAYCRSISTSSTPAHFFFWYLCYTFPFSTSSCRMIKITWSCVVSSAIQKWTSHCSSA